jgi:4,5-dihydroxyphthalate decarboxylase
MNTYKVSIACRNYDGTNALIRGLVKTPGIDLQVFECNDVVEMFSAMFRGKYDVAEMSLAELVYYVSRRQCDFIGIPVFPSRIFRHSFIYCNARSGISCPEDLNGKKIGFLRWVQTAHIWVRGFLADEYGISPRETRWYVAGLHHWSEQTSTEELRPRNGALINWLKFRQEDEYESICNALLTGELDALVTTENHRYQALSGEHERVKRLFGNPKEAEISYYKKTKIFPIMHILVARKDLIRKYPDLGPKLFDRVAEAN